MADNTPQTGTATIATDDVTTLNGGASAGVQVQRVKVGYGDDNSYRDASLLFPLPVINTEGRAANLAATITAAAGAAATLSLPAPGAGLFHYITSLEVSLYSAAARVGAAAPIVVTTTNLPGAMAFTLGTAAAIGVIDRCLPWSDTPIKSSVANTASTIVAPIVAGGIWRITATYFTAA